MVTVLSFLFIFLNFSFATDYVSGDKLFIGGYDPVNYHTKNTAQKGELKFSYKYDNVQILFSSKENKTLFMKFPEKYMPAYKGWCAFAMAQNGNLVGVNPKTFKVIKGKLYLFYNNFWVNTLRKWNKKSDLKQIESADEFWGKMH